jgi:hypothetical protein
MPVLRYSGGTTYLRLGHAQPDEADTRVCKKCVHQEDTPSHVRDHVGGRSRDAVVHDPVGEEAEAVFKSVGACTHAVIVKSTNLMQKERYRYG